MASFADALLGLDDMKPTRVVENYAMAGAMARFSFRALLLLGLSVVCTLAYPQATVAPGDPPLGSGHLWLKAGKSDLNGEVTKAWGADREGYLALEGYGAFGGNRHWYAGGELGRAAAGTVNAGGGDGIRDFRFWWLEFNLKRAFDLTHGLSLDVGLGSATFFVGGDEEYTLGDVTVTAPLADVGFGAQALADFTWRKGRLLIGVDAKYQWAFDVIAINYSNLRLGAHLGLRFGAGPVPAPLRGKF